MKKTLLILVLLLLPQLALASGNYTWTQQAAAGSRKWESIAGSSDGTVLAATVQNGNVYLSTNSGSTWTAESSLGTAAWAAVAVSGNGQTIIVGNQSGGYMYISTNGGATWTAATAAGVGQWDSIAVSSDGTKIAAVTLGNNNGNPFLSNFRTSVYISTNSGATWTAHSVSGSSFMEYVAMSSNGTDMAVADGPGTGGSSYVFTSTDGGTTWTQRAKAANSGRSSDNWTNLVMSPDGTEIIAADLDYMYLSTNGGSTFTQLTQPGFSSGHGQWTAIQFSSNDLDIAAASGNVDTLPIYTTINSGTTWTSESGSGSLSWSGMTMSSDGSKLAASVYNGYIYTAVATPTCTVSFSSDPAPYNYTGNPVTLTWSSQFANTMYINSIGYVSGSGTTSVPSMSSTDYSCSAANGSATSTTPATLSVSAPPSPATSIAASSTSIYAGQSINVTADFAPGSGDALTADNIDEPVGSGQGGTTNPDASKTIIFSTTTPGTYTFYSRAETDYYTSWTTYSQLSVTVKAAPSCSVTLSPTSIAQGSSSTLTYSSSNATSFSINNVGSKTADTSGHVTVNPSQTTDYTGTASASGVSNQCPASLSVSCTQSWSCSGSTIVQTNTDCSTTNLTTCVSPQYCQAGSNSCLYPTISFNSSGNQTGHLQLLPNVVHGGNSTTVAWNVSDAQSCAVTGTNGDSWTGLSGSATSSPIASQVTYTLSCQAYGSNPNDTETQTVTVAPTYQEK